MSPEQQAVINAVLLIAVTLGALWTVMTARLVYAVIGLAVTSAVLTIVMFMMNAPIAGVFELSVCAGLIPAIFLSAISVARKLNAQTAAIRTREQIRRFWLLPVITVLVGVVLMGVSVAAPSARVAAGPAEDVRTVMWNMRQLDILGQIVVLLAGAFAVIILLKESKNG